MRTINRTLFFASVLSGAASVAVADPVAVPWTRGPNSCGTPQVAQSSDIPVYDAAVGQRVLWVNKAGGHFTVATTDSTKNTVSTNILQTQVSQFTIAKMPSGFNWAVVRACVDEEFKNFNIRVVETKPSIGDYVQAVVGGTGAEIGFSPQSGILGITSTDNFCHVAERGITLNFAQNHLGIPKQDQELCATITHEAGHAFSLEHEILDVDLMSYIPVSQAASKEFVDRVAHCGTDPQTQNACSCTNTNNQTNSGMRLTANVGTRPTDGTAPSLTVQSPSDGKLAPAFQVIAKATDASGMADVVVSIDGTEVGNDEAGSGGTYTISGTASLGMHMLTVTARDLAGNLTKKDIPVTVAKLDIGETCTGNDACTGNLCATGGDGAMFCTQTCDPAASTCPDGFTCDATAKVCAPDDSGGCCSASSPRQGVTAMLFGIGVGAVLIRKRRPKTR